MPSWIRSVRVVPNRVVEFSVEVGKAQIASSLLILGEKEIAKAKRNSFTENLGADTIGKELICGTLVQDVRSETDDTEVTFIVRSAGLVVAERTLSQKAKPNDFVAYRAQIRFRPGATS
jgi:hypothetical protein